MSVLLFLIAIALLCGLVYWLDIRKKPKPRVTFDDPLSQKPFTPLADSLAGKLPDVLERDPQHPLPKERPLPKPRKRPVNKGVEK